MADVAHPLAVLAAAIEASLAAGDYFRDRLKAEKQVKTKSSPADLVTDVDPECERRIRAIIASRFPTHKVLGEETTEPGSAAAAKAAGEVAAEPALWIVDPLDGTTNFVNEIPLSTVSIAYAEHGQLQVGVIYDPYHGEVFLGAKGQGAWVASVTEAQTWATQPQADLPGRRLQVSGVSDLIDAVVATGFPTRAAARMATLQAGLRMCGTVKSVRALGSAALHLAYVASGRVDGFWELDLNVWDMAAGVLLTLEAGGCARSFEGTPYRLEVRDIIVSGTLELADAIGQSVVGDGSLLA